MPFLLRRPTDDVLVRCAEAARDLELSYSPVGLTSDPSVAPAGFRVDRYGTDIDAGLGAFERGVEALRSWAAHRGAGLRVAPGDASLAEGVTVVVAHRLALVTVVAPARIVRVVDTPDRFGFAYGTLTGHPARGEESFMLTRTATGLRFDVLAVSRPAMLLARVGTAITRRAQAMVTRRYLSGLEAAVESR